MWTFTHFFQSEKKSHTHSKYDNLSPYIHQKSIKVNPFLKFKMANRIAYYLLVILFLKLHVLSLKSSTKNIFFGNVFHEIKKSTTNSQEKEILLDMRNFQRYFVATLIGVSTQCLLPFSTFSSEFPIFEEVWGIVNENFVDSSFHQNDWNKVRKDYLDKLSSGANEQQVIKKMLKLLDDKYTRILDKEFFEGLWKYDAIGVGLLFKSSPNKEMIVAAPPITGSSGEKAGIKKGDYIFSINGRSTDKMTAMDVLDMMSNDESNTVTLVYGHASDQDDTTIDMNTIEKKSITLVRSKQEATNPVSYSLENTKDGTKAGYIRLKEFNSEAVAMMKYAIEDLENQGAMEYILDLRGNTGGGFQFALNIGGMFMTDRPMVTALGRVEERNVFKSSYPNGALTDKPLALWIDGLSASASEVLAGGLHDNCRAALVGSQSFGKGKIQAVFGLSDGEGLTLTVAQYITPKGQIIQSKGLSPDIPMQTISPYVRILVDPIIGSNSRPDVSRFDFNQVKNVMNMCEKESSSSSSS